MSLDFETLKRLEQHVKKEDYDDEEGEVPGEQDTGPDEKMCPECGEKMEKMGDGEMYHCTGCGYVHEN